MKLLTSDQSELMEVGAFKTDNGNLIVVGTIMGAMPVEAVLTPSELRKVFRLLSLSLVCFVIVMLVRR